MQKKIFIQYGLDNSLTILEIERIICFILDIQTQQYFFLEDIDKKHFPLFKKYANLYKKGIPEAYIFGECEFYGRKFFTSPETLIPRQDTETLVDGLKRFSHTHDTQKFSYIDIGTGTACIPISFMCEISPKKFSSIYISDISHNIGEIAQKNIDFHNREDITFLQGSLFEIYFNEHISLEKKLLISANLPYIKQNDIKNIGKSVFCHEPESALYGGKDTGFELYEQLIVQLLEIKKQRQLEEIHLFIEIGFDQKKYSKQFLEEKGLQFEYFLDMSKIERVLYIYDF